MILGIRRRIEQQEAAFAEARRFAERLAERHSPLTAILFGSFARGDFHDGSDVDLLLISDAFPAHPMERDRALYELSPGGIDLFAYRSGEFREMLKKNHPTAYWAAREGKVVWNEEYWKEMR